MVLEEKTKEELNIDFQTCGVWKKVWCVCDYCGTQTLRFKRSIIDGWKHIKKDCCNDKICSLKKREEANLFLYGVKNYFSTQEFKEKSTKTCLEKYGTKNPQQSESHKEKIKATCLERYGVEHVLQTDFCREANKSYLKDNLKFVQEKIKATCLERYGVEHYAQTDIHKKNASLSQQQKTPEQKSASVKKTKETNLQRYGVEVPIQSKIIQSKVKATCLERYGVEHAQQSPEIQKKTRETNLQRYGAISPTQSTEILLKGKLTNIKKYGMAHPTKFKKTEIEIKNWLLELSGLHFNDDVKILHGKEIDLYNEDKKIGIEYCGLFWHTEHSLAQRGKNYHYDKYKNCIKKNIHLITIFSDEWDLRKNQCKNFLSSTIGVFTQKIYARKCIVSEIDKTIFDKFVDDHHIQGATKRSIFRIGLFYNNALVGVMSLAKHHRNIKDQKIIVLDRLCFANDIQIIGGSSRLLKHCIEWARENQYEKIISWSDNRWSQGTVYERLGFVLEKQLPPDYSYVNLKNPKKRLSKQSQKKSNTGCPENVTESEHALKNGLARIWDCGKKRWYLTI